MPIGDPRDKFFYSPLTFIMDSYSLVIMDTCAKSYENQAKHMEVKLQKQIVSMVHLTPIWHPRPFNFVDRDIKIKFKFQTVTPKNV